MLTKDYLADILIGRVLDIKDPDTQIQEAQGLDTITTLLTSFNSVRFPVIILEGRSNGAIQVHEGPVDFFTQSIWVMEQMGEGDDENSIYDQAFSLAKEILSVLLQESRLGYSENIQGWDYRRTAYMKRYGGPNARGWEFVLSFSENFSLE